MTEPLNRPNQDDPADNLLSIEDRLSKHLKGEAELIPTEASLGQPASLGALRDRAERRRSRRQAGLGAVAAACVAVVGFGALQLGSDDQQLDVAATETSTTLANDTDEAATSTGPSDAAANDQNPLAEMLANDGPQLEWEEASSLLPDGVLPYSITGAPDAFYALAIESDRTSSVFRSVDGLNWEEIATGIEIEGFRLQHVDGALLIEGSQPFSEADGADVVETPIQYLISYDDGATWSEIELPPPATIDAPNGTLEYETSASVTIAATGDVIVAVQASFFFADVEAILAEDGIESMGWEVLDEGLRIYTASDGEESLFVPFADLTAFQESELSDDEIRSLLQADQSDIRIFRSEGGGPFEEIDFEIDADSDFASITSAGDAFILQSFGTDPASYRSTDGRTWSKVDTEVEAYQPNGGGQSLIGYGADGLAESLDGGQTWTTIDPGTNLVNLIELLRSDLGLTVVASGGGSFAPENIEITKDNLTFVVNFDELGEGDMVLFDNQSGEELRRIRPDEMTDDGNNGPGLVFDEDAETITITDLDTGDVLFTFTVNEFMEANPEIAPDSTDEGMPAFYIGHSVTDGEFGWISVEDLSDSPDAFPVLAATDNAVLVTFEGPGATQAFVAQQVTE